MTPDDFDLARSLRDALRTHGYQIKSLNDKRGAWTFDPEGDNSSAALIPRLDDPAWAATLLDLLPGEPILTRSGEEWVCGIYAGREYTGRGSSPTIAAARAFVARRTET